MKMMDVILLVILTTLWGSPLPILICVFWVWLKLMQHIFVESMENWGVQSLNINAIFNSILLQVCTTKCCWIFSKINHQYKLNTFCWNLYLLLKSYWKNYKWNLPHCPSQGINNIDGICLLPQVHDDLWWSVAIIGKKVSSSKKTHAHWIFWKW
jgi:hypothetical protein